MISQDPKLWGPHTWIFLDSVVASFPNELISSETEADVERMFNFWNYLYLPCKECMVHYIEFLAANPIETVNNRSSYEAWYHLLKKNVFQHKQSQQPANYTISSSSSLSSPSSYSTSTTPQVEVHIPPSSPASRIKSIRNLPIPSVYQSKNVNRYGSSRISRSRAPGSSILSTIPIYTQNTQNTQNTHNTSINTNQLASMVTNAQQRQSKDPSRGARGCSSCGGGTRAVIPKR